MPSKRPRDSMRVDFSDTRSEIVCSFSLITLSTTSDFSRYSFRRSASTLKSVVSTCLTGDVRGRISVAGASSCGLLNVLAKASINSKQNGRTKSPLAGNWLSYSFVQVHCLVFAVQVMMYEKS